MKVNKPPKAPPAIKTVTIRFQEESLKMITALAKEYGVSRQLIVNRIIEKSLKARNFSIEL